MSWDEIAAKEGQIYCQKKDTWCAYVNMKNGTCNHKKCVLETEPNGGKEGETDG